MVFFFEGVRAGRSPGLRLSSDMVKLQQHASGRSSFCQVKGWRIWFGIRPKAFHSKTLHHLRCVSFKLSFRTTFITTTITVSKWLERDKLNLDIRGPLLPQRLFDDCEVEGVL